MSLHVPNVVTRCLVVLCGAVTCTFALPGAAVEALPFHAGSRSAAPSYDVLPVGWRADIGIPVAWNGMYVYLFGDTWTDEGFARNTVVVDGTVITDALPATASGSIYWPGDGVELPDGRLLVVMGEVADRADATQEELDTGMAFDAVDTDAFIVTDPTNPMSWKLATKIDAGPWGDASVQFSDQWPLVFVREPRSFETTVYRYDPADPTTEWIEVDADLPDSFGMFVPVQTADGWWGVTMSDWNAGAFWRAPDASGPWLEVETFETEGRTYDHGLSVVDGRVVWHWSNGEGIMRPEYTAFTMED